MSALLPHIKAARVMATTFREQVAYESGETAQVARMMCFVYERAAEALEKQARAEATAEPGSKWEPPSVLRR